MGTWKIREEAYHGSKWGYVATALVIIIVLSLLGSIMYLLSEGAKATYIDPFAVAAWVAVIILLIVIFIILAWVFSSVFSFFAQLWGVIWALFSNVYILVIVLILTVIVFYMVLVTVAGSVEITLANPLVIGVLIALFILFLPFAIFLIDLFTYEHE